MSLNKESDIQVSVCVVTYNQEKYIAECLESLVTQQTSFKFEIIVGEDCSTDRTRAIVQQYVEQYPDLVIPLFHENNVGAVENVKRVYKAAKGKYIAHMDGDDLALPDKLKKQFDIMEKGYVICSHNVCSLDENNSKNCDFWISEENEYDWKFYLSHMPFFAHSSKMFVKEHLRDLLDNMYPNVCDFEIHLESIKYGKIYHLKENLGIYRLDSGVMINDKDILIKMIDSKFRVYGKSLDYFNDPIYVKKKLITDFFRFVKICILKRNYNKIIDVINKFFYLVKI